MKEQQIKHNEVQIKKFINKLKSEWNEIHCCYEAGVTGYSLYTYLSSLRVNCTLVTPGKIHNQPHIGPEDKSVGIPTKSPVKLSSHNATKHCVEFPSTRPKRRPIGRCLLSLGSVVSEFPLFLGGMERFGRFFSIRKSYFLQVKNLILVGTLEK